MADADMGEDVEVLPHPAMDLVEPHGEDVPHLVPFVDDDDDDDDLPDPPAQVPMIDEENPGELNQPDARDLPDPDVLTSPAPNPAPVRSVLIPLDKTDIDPGGLNGMTTFSTMH